MLNGIASNYKDKHSWSLWSKENVTTYVILSNTCYGEETFKISASMAIHILDTHMNADFFIENSPIVFQEISSLSNNKYVRWHLVLLFRDKAYTETIQRQSHNGKWSPFSVLEFIYLSFLRSKLRLLNWFLSQPVTISLKTSHLKFMKIL